MLLPTLQQIATIAGIEDVNDIQDIYLIQEQRQQWFKDSGETIPTAEYLWVVGPIGIYPAYLLKLDYHPRTDMAGCTVRLVEVNNGVGDHLALHQFLVDHYTLIPSLTQIGSGGKVYSVNQVFNWSYSK